MSFLCSKSLASRHSINSYAWSRKVGSVPCLSPLSPQAALQQYHKCIDAHPPWFLCTWPLPPLILLFNNQLWMVISSERFLLFICLAFKFFFSGVTVLWVWSQASYTLDKHAIQLRPQFCFYRVRVFLLWPRQSLNLTILQSLSPEH